MAGMFALKKKMEHQRIQSETSKSSLNEQIKKGEEVEKKTEQNLLKEAIAAEKLIKEKAKRKALEYDEEEGDFKSNFTEPYSLVYIGLVLISLGMVISFVGLGEKGFKTTELKIIGPILLSLGFSCVVFKVVQCYCPMLQKGYFNSKTAKLSDRSSLVESGLNNMMHRESLHSPNSIKSPRIVLQPPSTQQAGQRPKSTIPNYIDDSSDDDDFDPGRPNYFNSPTGISKMNQRDLEKRQKRLLSPRERELLNEKMLIKNQNITAIELFESNSKIRVNTLTNEIILDPLKL